MVKMKRGRNFSYIPSRSKKLVRPFWTAIMAWFIRRFKNAHPWIQQIYPKKITEEECEDSPLSVHTFRMVISLWGTHPLVSI